MSGSDRFSPRVHEDTVLFGEAINFTAAQTGFSPQLIEKDYFCTVLLAHLSSIAGSPVVFKGGTCLAKIHAAFYRMSEDLDFTIPVETTGSRSQRSRLIADFKHSLATIEKKEPVLSLSEPLRGANQSRQYLGSVQYQSVNRNAADTIKIEVSLREPLLTPAQHAAARTALLDPVSGEPLVADITVLCLSKVEAFAEKFRAALTRREVAIRDFYDIDRAVTHLGLHAADPEMVSLVRKKIAIPGNDPVDVGERRRSILRTQVSSRLRPVLRRRDYEEFNLDRAIAAVVEMAALVSGD